MGLKSKQSKDEEEDRRASAAMSDFTSRQIQTFEPNFGRSYFFSNLGKTVIYGSIDGNGKNYDRSPSDVDPTVIVKSGWLMKQGNVVKNWKRRWFILRRCDEGPTLSYYNNPQEATPKRVIVLGPTSRTILTAPKNASKESEIKIMSSVDSAEREFVVCAENSFETSGWLAAIEATIRESNMGSFQAEFSELWNDAGIRGFLVYYGVRKRNGRGSLQTRVLEFNFAEHTIHNTRRGETQTSLPFSAIRKVSVCAPESRNDGYGLQIEFVGHHRSWPIYLDTKRSRDDILSLIQRVLEGTVNEATLRCRWPHLVLKSGYMERRNVGKDHDKIGPHATIKGRLFITLHEYQLMCFAEKSDLSCRPWFVFSLPGLEISHKPERRLITLGRCTFVCDTKEECLSWYAAISAAVNIPKEIVQAELENRRQIKIVHQSTVRRLRKLLKASVTPQPHAPPKDHHRVLLMLKTLWALLFPNEVWSGYTSSQWQNIGFQRGGPASDLRSSGLLGLHCLIYFVKNCRCDFQKILNGQKSTQTDGRMLNYPVAIACINVVALLVEMLGIGDAGIHSEGSSELAATAFASIVANASKKGNMNESQYGDSLISVGSPTSFSNEKNGGAENGILDADSLVEQWQQSVMSDNSVFEDIFCIIFPILDRLFVEMGAGYMEFGQVLLALRRRIDAIFSLEPSTIDELRKLALEPCTDVLMAPAMIADSARLHS